METYKGKHVKSKEKPLVMVVKNTKKGTSMIIGVMDYNRSSNYVKKYVICIALLFIFSDFGQKFRIAAEKTGARTKHDGFDTAMIEVKNEDARPFMEELEHSTEI